jgi:outer membrane protein OmpA-like peptidoglycan-associated protein
MDINALVNTENGNLFFIQKIRLRIILRPICLFFIFHFSFFTTFAQNKKAIEVYQKGIKAINEQKPDRATAFMDEAIALDSMYAEAYFKRAQLFDIFSESEQSIKYFRKSIQLSPDLAAFAPAYQKLIQYHLRASDYSLTRSYLEKYITFVKPNSVAFKQAQRQLDICKNGEKAILTPLQINPEVLSDTVNKNKEQYFPSLTTDGETLLFTTLIDDNNEDLYITQRKNGSWAEPVSISSNINSLGNEGAGSISGDGRTLVFTGCNRLDGYGSCDLYISQKIGDIWGKPKNLGVNVNSAYRERQPSLSADGQTLYFISERLGGQGGDDIWFSTLQANGQWSKAQNVGKTVNSIYDEASPFIHANGHTLFFASEGHDGIGGYDIFMSDSTALGWQKPENIGYPINTSDNQVAFVITADGKIGYYTKGIESQRVSKLYRVTLPASLQQKIGAVNTLNGIITDSQTHKPLKANIELYDQKTNKVVARLNSDNLNGNYAATIPNGGEWGLYVSAEGYYYKSLLFDYSQKNNAEGFILNVSLDPLTTANRGVLNNIYFETAKAELKEKSKTELDKLIQFLTASPSLRVEITGHTDDIGDTKQNVVLSQKRAQAVTDYLIKSGIRSNRIKAVGYGKTRPIVPNTSDENRRQNRRIEWRII